MTPACWPCPLPHGGTAEEYALTFDRGRSARLLIVPALFDESNRLRRFTVDVMRRLDAAGIDSLAIDLPGCNESLQPLEAQDAQGWTRAIMAACTHFGATHVLGIRGGALFVPADLPAWHYAPVKGASILRQMVRARLLAAREAGREETREGLMKLALAEGIKLAGYRLGPQMAQDLEGLTPAGTATVIAQEQLGGAGLWLRAEPGDSAEQADALASALAAEITP